jgi:glutathione S-transferase
MITFYCFGRVLKAVHGETRDLRVQWALEETGLPYREQGVDHTGGENLGPEYSKISLFNQMPAIDDDGFVLAESGSILLYLAEKSGKLIPADFQGRTRVVQWCFAALTTVETPLQEILSIDKFKEGRPAERRAELVKWAGRVLGGVERRLDGREWIACEKFTVADILLTSVLREIRKTDLLEPYPNLESFYARAQARPAWQRALESYAKRLGTTVEEIR